MLDEGAGDADALLLAPAEVDPTFAEHGVEPVLKRFDVLTNAGVLGRLSDLLFVRLALAKGDVVADGVAEQEDVLRHVAQVLFHGVEVPFRKGGAVQGDAAFLRIHHAHGQLKDRGFPAAGAAGDAQRFSCVKRERDVVEGLDAGVGIGPRHAIEFKGWCGRQAIRASSRGRRRHSGGGVQKVQDAVHGSFRFLDQRGHPTDRGERPGQQVDVEDELEDVAQLQVAAHHALSAHIDGEDGAQPHQQDDERHEHGFHLDQVEHTHFVRGRLVVEPLGGVAFAVEALQHPNACDVLLHEA